MQSHVRLEVAFEASVVMNLLTKSHVCAHTSPMEESVSQSQSKLWPYVLSLFRVIVGALFVCHGAATVFGVLGGTGAGTAAPAGAWPGWWAGLIQLVSGALVALGLGTRIAALLGSGSMAYAYFSVHQVRLASPVAAGLLSVMLCQSGGCCCCSDGMGGAWKLLS